MHLELPALGPLGIGLAGAAALQLVSYVVMLRTRNAGIVDATWATSLAMMGVAYPFLYDGEAGRQLLIAVLVGGWGARLAWHLWVDRVLGHPEEGRYVRLREIWGDRADLHFLWFFQLQAVLAVVLSLPFAYAASSAAPFPAVTDFVAAGLWIAGIVGESVADHQLKRFKQKAESKGRTCREGLWRYSRHPNYFFEWILWCSFAAAGTAATGGWLGWIAPLIIYVFINHVTGIPPTEAQSLRSRGDDYRDYQRTTSPFFPWFPRTPQERT